MFAMGLTLTLLPAIALSSDCACRQSNGMEYLVETNPEAPGGRGFKYKDVWYPKNYGTASCEAWDEHHPDCTVQGSKPLWCQQKWCYVYPACQADDLQHTDVLSDGTLIEDLSFSYEACGSTDWYTPLHFPSNFSTVEALNQQAVQVIVSKDMPETPFCQELMEEIRKHILTMTSRKGISPFANLTFEIKVEKTGFLAEEDLSTFQEYEQAFQFGRYHIGCLKTADLSTERRAMGLDFSQPVIPQQYLMISTKDATTPKLLGAFAMLQPFDLGIWAMLLCTMILLSLMLCLLDVLGVASVLSDEERKDKNASCFVRAIDSLFLTFSAMIGRPLSNSWGARSCPARMLYLASAAGSVFFVATYTANLTDFLQQTRLHELPSFNRLADPSLKICDGYAGGGRSVIDVVKTVSGEGSHHAQLVGLPGYGAYDCIGEAYRLQTGKYCALNKVKYSESRITDWQVQALFDGHCEAILFSKTHAEWLLYNQQPSPECSLVEVESGVQTQSYALVFRKQELRLKELVDAALLSLRKNGKIDAMYNKYWRSKVCMSEGQVTEEQADQLQLDSYIGFLVIVLAFTGCAFLSLVGSALIKSFLPDLPKRVPSEKSLNYLFPVFPVSHSLHEMHDLQEENRVEAPGQSPSKVVPFPRD